MTRYFSPIDFIVESNRIEGIHREPTDAEVQELARFLNCENVQIADLVRFVGVYQPGARLRTEPGMNVRVGKHIPPPGGDHIWPALSRILDKARQGPKAAYGVHCEYETLHPFTDGNGRSGRMLWLWMMREAPLGFLHTFYYQTLAALEYRSNVVLGEAHEKPLEHFPLAEPYPFDLPWEDSNVPA